MQPPARAGPCPGAGRKRRRKVGRTADLTAHRGRQKLQQQLCIREALFPECRPLCRGPVRKQRVHVHPVHFAVLGPSLESAPRQSTQCKARRVTVAREATLQFPYCSKCPTLGHMLCTGIVKAPLIAEASAARRASHRRPPAPGSHATSAQCADLFRRNNRRVAVRREHRLPCLDVSGCHHVTPALSRGLQPQRALGSRIT